jgi:hypothetical protein
MLVPGWNRAHNLERPAAYSTRTGTRTNSRPAEIGRTSRAKLATRERLELDVIGLADAHELLCRAAV